MNFPNFIAKRYLFSKKSKSIINIISLISIIGVFVSSTAMIIVLSGFNGIEKLVENIYSKHEADILISTKIGKTFYETEIGKLQGKIDQINTLSVTQETELEALEKKRQDLENNNSFNSGPQLKKDIYEENTNLTMSLIYYVLGIGFMGYYIVKTLKKTA